MKKLIRKIKVIAWLFLILGVGASIALLICYYYLAKDPSESINLYILIGTIVLAGLAILHFFTSYFLIYLLNRDRHNTDLKTIDIVGNDIGAAYDFGQIGLIVVNSDGVVLWINDFLLSRGLNIVDSHISTFSSVLNDLMVKSKNQELSSKDKEPTIQYENNYYEVMFISKANLFILRDTTSYETCLQVQRNNSAVMGYLNIDNYSDMPAVDEISKASNEAALRKIVNDYFYYSKDPNDQDKATRIVVKTIRIDFYLILLTREDLEMLRKDNFSIISTISEKFKAYGLTASLGFGYGFPSFQRLSELADSALNIALSRGGNQCVLAPYGESMIFYGGGNTESKTHNNKVKIITYAKSLMATIKQANNVIIVPHVYADMDAIGACLGVHCICNGLKTKSYIAYDASKVESCAEKAIRSSLNNDYFNRVLVNTQQAIRLKNANTLIIMVDHNSVKQSIMPSIIDERYDKIAIIDHHRKQDNSVKEVIFENIDSSSSSTCELISLYIDSYTFKIDVPSYIATIMLSGIYLDTSSFKQKTRVLTYEACIILSRLNADEKKAVDLLKENYEAFVIKSKILANVEIYQRDILIASGDDNTTIDAAMLASVCNELKEIESTKLAFAVGRLDNNSIYISSRSNGQVNCELLMMKLNGGGHFAAAATKLVGINVKQAIEQLKHVLDQYLKDAINTSNPDEED